MSYKINHGNAEIKFDIIYRQRKTMEIQVLPSGNVLVLVPKGIAKERVFDAISNKGNWIINKLQIVYKQMEQQVTRRFVDGETVLYMGEEYLLKIGLKPQANHVSVQYDNRQFLIESPNQEEDFIKSALEQWFKQQALIKIEERVNHYSDFLGKRPVRVKISNAQKRWGTCTHKGNLLVNWRCVLAPPAVLDYVVAHEMCHLIYFNHSKNFWQLVLSIIPDYQQQRQWLKDYGNLLYF